MTRQHPETEWFVVVKDDDEEAEEVVLELIEVLGLDKAAAWRPHLVWRNEEDKDVVVCGHKVPHQIITWLRHTEHMADRFWVFHHPKNQIGDRVRRWKFNDNRPLSDWFILGANKATQEFIKARFAPGESPDIDLVKLEPPEPAVQAPIVDFETVTMLIKAKFLDGREDLEFRVYRRKYGEEHAVLYDSANSWIVKASKNWQKEER